MVRDGSRLGSHTIMAIYRSIAAPAYTSMCPIAHLNQREPERSKEG
jgi:hypothetical protein